MKTTDELDWVGRQGAGGPAVAVGPGRLGPVYESMTRVTTGLGGLPLTPFSETELWDAAAELARLQQASERGLVHVIAELTERGVECPGGLSPVDWLRGQHPGLTAGHARAIVAVGQACREPRWGELTGLVRSGAVTVAAAAQVIGFHERVHLVADPDELDAAIAELTSRAASLPAERLARWVRHHTETLIPPRDSAGLDTARRASRGLWFDPPCATGMVAGRFTLDPEGAAIVRAAIDPLAAPRPALGPDGRVLEPDPRTPATRRADALLEVIGRGVASPGAAPSTDRAKVLVTIDLPVLEERIRGCGHTLTGQVLTAATVRRIACDAQVVPVVLGTDGAPLDVGRGHRLVPPAIRHAAWLRDQGCTYPGCTIPPAWCDAHHVTHWADGGSTSLDNTALLCGRHHTLVHQRALTATITTTGVTWHL